jgi:ADP-ribosylglycohydrolase
MLGAIIGDIVGSRFEFEGFKSKEFELFTDESTFTDDTVMTIAVASTLLAGSDPASTLRIWGGKYPDRGYGGMFDGWLKLQIIEAYNSYGNGAAMRVSPAAWLSTDLSSAHYMAIKVTEVTHNHPEGIKGALATATAIWLAREGWTQENIRLRVSADFGYDMSRSVDEIRPDYDFDVTCQGSVPEALICAFEATSYEDAIRNAVSLGGDSDTQACIAGGLAEALFGVPDDIIVRAYQYLPDEMLDVIGAMYSNRISLK